MKGKKFEAKQEIHILYLSELHRWGEEMVCG